MIKESEIDLDNTVDDIFRQIIAVGVKRNLYEKYRKTCDHVFFKTHVFTKIAVVVDVALFLFTAIYAVVLFMKGFRTGNIAPPGGFYILGMWGACLVYFLGGLYTWLEEENNIFLSHRTAKWLEGYSQEVSVCARCESMIIQEVYRIEKPRDALMVCQYLGKRLEHYKTLALGSNQPFIITYLAVERFFTKSETLQEQLNEWLKNSSWDTVLDTSHVIEKTKIIHNDYQNLFRAMKRKKEELETYFTDNIEDIDHQLLPLRVIDDSDMADLIGDMLDVFNAYAYHFLREQYLGRVKEMEQFVEEFMVFQWKALKTASGTNDVASTRDCELVAKLAEELLKFTVPSPVRC